MQGLSPLRQEVAADVGAGASALRKRAARDVVCHCWPDAHSGINPEISGITGSRTRDVCTTVAIATPMTTVCIVLGVNTTRQNQY